MSSHFNRLGKMFFILGSTSIIIGFAALYYYLNVKENERYQDQLHFRELAQVKTSIENGMKGFSRIGFNFQKIVNEHKNIKTDNLSKCPIKFYFNNDTCDNKPSPKHDPIKLLFKKTQPQTKSAFPSIDYINEKQVKTRSGPLISTGLGNKFSITLLPPKKTNNREKWHLSFPIKNDGTRGESSPNYGEIIISFGDIIPKENKLFPLILIIDNSGKLIFRKDNVEIDAFQHNLHFNNTKEILTRLANEQKSNTTNNTDEMKPEKKRASFPGYSGKLPITIAGEKYSTFISPWAGFSKNQNSGTPPYYLIGITPKSKLLVTKLAISNSTLVVLVFLILAIIALIPLLKVRLISYRQSFTQSDRQYVATGLSVLTILIISGTCHHLAYQSLNNEVKQKNIRAFDNLKRNFLSELSTFERLAEQNFQQIRDGIQVKPDHLDLSGLIFTPANIPSPTSTEARKTSIKGSFLENAVILKNDGMVKMALNPEKNENRIHAKWSSDALIPRSDLSLAHRKYFKMAKNCQGWGSPINNGDDYNCKSSTYMQRLINLIDGRKTTQFSQSLFESPSDVKDDEFSVYSFGGRFKTFFSPVLPIDSGFAVIENDSGTVIYHSDDERSLVENMFAATDNNSKLQNLIRASFSQEQFNFVSTYQGKPHLFSAGPLRGNIPWTLIVFHDKENMRNFSMLMGFSTIIILVLLALTCQIFYTILRASGKANYIQKLFWFNMDFSSSNVYRYLTLSLLALGLVATCIFRYVYFEKNAEISFYHMVIAILGYWGLVFAVIYTTLIRRHQKTDDNSTSAVPRHPSLIPARQDVDNYVIYIVTLLLVFWSIPSFLVANESAYFYLSKYSTIEDQFITKSISDAKKSQRDYFTLLTSDANKIHSEQYQSHLKGYLTVNDYSKDPENPTECPSTFGAGIFSTIWKNIDLNFNLASKISISAEANTNKRICHEFNETNNLWTTLLISFFLGAIALLWLVKKFVCRLLMGLFIPPNLRLGDVEHTDNKRNSLLVTMAITDEDSHKAKYAQLIRSTGCTRRMFSKTERDDKNTDLNLQISKLNLLTDEPVSFSDLSLSSDANIKELLTVRFNIPNLSISGTIVLTGLEMVATDKESRWVALAILYELISMKHLNIILLADIAPLYRLTRQFAYPGIDKDQIASAHEVIQWSRALKRFVKHYDWTPCERKNLPASATSYETLQFEQESWPELTTIYHEFLEYHSTVKDNDTQFERNDEGVVNDLTEKAKKQLKDSINKNWLPEQVVEFFAANAGAAYRYRWELCTKEERLLLIQLARGDTPNPLNLEPIEHMVRRGYVYQYNGWHLVNNSFSRFLLTAEDERTVENWMDDASESSWKYIRIPLFLIMIVILAMLAYTATDAFESFAAILTTTLGVVPLILKGIGFARGSSSNISEN